LPEGLVNRVIVPSFVDGPGSRMAVFLQGCGLACVHCHNPETRVPCGSCGACVEVCPQGALEYVEGRVAHRAERCAACDRCLEACPNGSSPRCRTLDTDALLAEVRPWVPFLDGITFTGGECTLQGAFLLDCLPRLKAETGLDLLLDTCGDVDGDVFEALLAVADGVLFDVKALGEEAHRALTGAGAGRILRNLDRAARAGKITEVRTVVVPGFTDDPAMLRDIALLVAGLGSGVPLVVAGFRPQGVQGALAQEKAVPPADLEHLCGPARAVLGDRLRLR